MRVAVVASAQIFGGFQNLPPPQSLDFSAFFGLSHLFPPRLSISVIFDTDLVTSQLLRDMQVVTVKEQSGVYVRSAENAKRYLQMVGEKHELQQKKQRLRALLAQQEAVARQVSELCGSILDDSVQPEQAAEQLKTFSCRVPQDWPDAGKTLGSLHFWQATGATVVAIARADALTVSPGPYAELRSEDRILFVGDQEAREAVARFFSKTETT